MLSNEDLCEIKGGAIKAGVVALIIAGVTFIIGVVDGYLRPLRCN
jgi:lactobin A/cerein 7B family class IIb bacteriocin